MHGRVGHLLWDSWMIRWLLFFFIALLALPMFALAQDADLDDVDDDVDNCPTFSNKDQADRDGDGVGDVCDNCLEVANFSQADDDQDGYGDDCDNCPGVVNDQDDYDIDGVGDECDFCVFTKSARNLDDDDDGLGNACDNCPQDANSDQRDEDGDGFGDVCEPKNPLDPGNCDSGCRHSGLPPSLFAMTLAILGLRGRSGGR